MRRLHFLAVLAPALLMAAPTRAETPGFWDPFSAENLLRFAVQAGISGLRSQVDLQYDHLLPDIAAGQVTLTGIRAWPNSSWTSEVCKVEAESATIATANWSEWDHMGLRIDVTGLTVPLGCLPLEARHLLAAGGMEQVDLVHAYLTLDYRPSSAAATVALHVDSPGLATVDATADFSYVAMEARWGSDPKPYAYLSGGRLEVENRGAWALARSELPPAMQEPAAAAAALELGLRQAIQQGGALTREQEAFLTSARAEAERFLTSEDRIAVEISVLEGEVFLDERLLNDPRELFRVLRPVVRTQSAARPALLSSALLEQVMAGSGSAEDRLAVGMALVNGNGVPKAVARGEALLAPLADAGNGAAALALARALKTAAPARAYGLALQAAAAGEAGATAVVDGLEAGLPMEDVLSIQVGMAGADALPDDAFASLGTLRDAALARMSGKGAVRSYPRAWFWASIGAAAGDPASISMRDQIERRMRAHGDAATAAWQAATSPLADEAVQVWISRNLAARYAN